jgi:hypothetical protein
MARNRNDDPDPLEGRRRRLAEQERLLAEQRRRLTEQLQRSNEFPAPAKPAEPPVWRMEEEGHSGGTPDPTPARKRHLARQRQRDMVLFFLFIGLFFVVVLGIWIAYVHNMAAANGG